MIIGEHDRERVATAELKAMDLGEQVEEWRRRARVAEGEVAEHRAYVAQVNDWASSLAGEAGRVVEQYSDRAAVAEARLVTTLDAMRELHVEAAEDLICRHCGFAWPCPSIAALPS